jgi:hypothetical protein
MVVGRILVLPMVVGVVLAVDEGRGEIVGTVGARGVGPTKPTMGETAGVGTAGTPLTPRLPISVEPKGIPVRLTPPGAVGAVEAGVDDDATLLEPEPHIPDIPAVSSVPEVVDTPDVLKGSEESESPDDADDPDIAVLPDIAPLAVPAVAGAPVPIPSPIPPPSKLVVDPNVVDGEVPTVEHAVPLLVLGIVIVPVTPVGAGLSPPEMISVDPSGIPVGPTDVPGPAPSGDVAPRVGVVGNVPTCAMAPLQANSAGSTAAINENLIVLPSCNRDIAARIAGIGSEYFFKPLPVSTSISKWLMSQSVQLNTRLFSYAD